VSKSLSLEQKDELKELTEHPAWPTLLVLLRALAHDDEARVLQFNLASGDERELVRLKCRAEGSANLLQRLKRDIEALTQRPKKGR
jgi:hypothetical protein